MTNDKLMQYVGLFGGLLSAILLFLGTLNIKFEWFTVDSISAFVVVLGACVPFALMIYSAWKNTYLLTEKSKAQEDVLKDKGLK